MKKFRWLTIGVFTLMVSLGSIHTAMAEGSLKQNFKQVDIRTVIEAVAKISGYNIIIDPRVKGKVTFIAPAGMNPSELYQSLLAVLRVHGYAAIEGDSAIKIIPANMARDQFPYRSNDLTNDDWVTEVISINNVEATKLVAVLRPLIAKEGHLVALSDSNKLIVTDVVSNIKRLKNILKRVDVDTLGHYEVITVLNSSAEELSKTIKGIIGKPTGSNAKAVKVSFDARSNRLILSGDEQKRMILRALIAHLDVKVESESQVQVIYLRYAKATEMAETLRKVAGNRAILNSAKSEANSGGGNNGEGGGSAPVPTRSLSAKQLKDQISIEADERMNALIISAPTAIAHTLKGVIKQLDIRRAQVLIEAIFVELSEDRAANLGIEWALLGQAGAGIVNFSGAIPSLLGRTAEAATAAQGELIGRGFTIGAGALNNAGDQGWGALISALNSDSSSNILATPSILTLDNEEAEIVVGREVPFQTGSFTSGNNAATNPFNTIERKNVGLKLKVKPQINEGNEIYLDIDQEISDVLPKGEAVDLQTTKRQIKTRVIVGDGNIVVLGGLINEKETQTESKVPFFGDLPWIGGLFRSTSTAREKVNLMIFLRPVIIRNNETSDYYSQKKYTYMAEEQTHLLDKKGSRLLSDEDLRPRLPTLQEWRGAASSTATWPSVNKSNVQPLVSNVQPTEPVVSPKNTGNLSDSTAELLDL
ncbi:General secretion pathway protein D [hydrothermal vent metagenome]|uniref:General secretion pathway protein D n=1 Tax=hydrothermal vent metagenome TaxID=652676 RepID=A0A3B0W898_9ZZZZ